MICCTLFHGKAKLETDKSWEVSWDGQRKEITPSGWSLLPLGMVPKLSKYSWRIPAAPLNFTQHQRWTWSKWIKEEHTTPGWLGAGRSPVHWLSCSPVSRFDSEHCAVVVGTGSEREPASTLCNHCSGPGLVFHKQTTVFYGGHFSPLWRSLHSCLPWGVTSLSCSSGCGKVPRPIEPGVWSCEITTKHFRFNGRGQHPGGSAPAVAKVNQRSKPRLLPKECLDFHQYSQEGTQHSLERLFKMSMSV